MKLVQYILRTILNQDRLQPDYHIHNMLGTVIGEVCL